MKNKNIILSIVALLVLAVVAGGSFVYFNNQKEKNERIEQAKVEKEEKKKLEEQEKKEKELAESESKLKEEQEKLKAEKESIEVQKKAQEEAEQQPVIEQPVQQPVAQEQQSTSEPVQEEVPVAENKPVQGVDIPTFQQWKAQDPSTNNSPYRYAVNYGLTLDEVDTSK